MDQDRSLKDIIRFLDPSGNISDADIAGITRQLKFTDVMDLVSSVSSDNMDAGRNLLKKYDDRFSIAKEYSSVPSTTPSSGFKKIAPQGTVGKLPSTANQQPSTGQQPTSQQSANGQETDIDQLINDPSKQNDPNVKQIQSLLQRLQNR